jgi:hypothetical protein
LYSECAVTEELGRLMLALKKIDGTQSTALAPETGKLVDFVAKIDGVIKQRRLAVAATMLRGTGYVHACIDWLCTASSFVLNILSM